MGRQQPTAALGPKAVPLRVVEPWSKANAWRCHDPGLIGAVLDDRAISHWPKASTSSATTDSSPS